MSDTASVAIVPRVHILSLFAAIISSWWHALPVLVLLVGLPMQLAAIIISLVTGFRPPADPTTIFTSPAFYLVLFGMFTSQAALAGLGAIIVIRRRLQVVSQGPRLLWYLKRLPLDQLKIDQSFVCDILTNPNDAAIARTIVALGQSLGLAVIAEGVETEAQRNFLAISGCHAYQGYFFSQPLPVEGFEKIAKGV